MVEEGTKVIAISHTDDKYAYIYGYGTYVGYDPCPLLNGYANPHIKLDTGEDVWGCQCWWDSVDACKDRIGNREIKIIPVNTMRR